MKKNYITSILLLCFSLSGLAQVTVQKKKHTARYYNSWRLGLNMGAMWQIADVRSTPGFAGGFTLEKAFCENETNFFSLALKGRGLWGSTYGLDFTRNYDIKNNPSLNGTYDPKVNYDTNAVAPYIYNNYKTKIAEGALELQICFNRLRERTNVLLNIWGGIGFTSYRTSVNLLDGSKRYNYNLVDSTGGQGSILSSHDLLLDGSYESFATGSRKGNVVTLSPSFGIGLGYRFNDFISLLYEYKVTLPQGLYSDYLDGIAGKNNDWLGGSKDYYKYTGLTLQIRMGGKSKGKTNSTSNVNNYTPVPTNTIVPTNSVVTNPTTSVVTQPTVAKPPIVTITNPPSTPYNETVNRNFNITANVFNVSQRTQLYVTFNGVEVKNYTWNNKTISFPAQLSVGNNIVSVTATNTAGNDSKSAVINYSGVPPQISITTPGSNKYTSTQSNSDVFATILNVEAAQNITVKFNGQPFYSFSYDVTSKVFGMNAALITGTNTVDITATNAFGQDAKTQLIIYKPGAVVNTTVVAVKPVTVVITDPPVNPYKSTTTTYKVKSVVTGVTSQNQVTVTVNSNVVPFTYVGGNVDFNVSLSAGTNLIQVSAKNGRQGDSKSTVITYDAPKKITPPTVVIINPNPSPYTTTGNTYPFKAQTTYITDKSQLEVKYNGAVISNYAFDATTGFIDLNVNLTLNSNNIFEVKATNQYGSANASAIVKQEQPKTKVICHRVDRGTMQTITILESDWAAHQAHGDFEGACQQSVDPQPDLQITICHKNADGSKQTISILQSTWPQHQAHGDVMGACPKIQTEALLDNDITICHMNADGSKQTIFIKESTWPQHQAHGDVKDACPKVNIETPIDIDPEMVICHKNNDGTETKMTIKQSQWAAHQAHGDYVGGNCAANTNTAATTTTIEICHNNGDGSKTTMIIPSSQFSAHRAHGDVMGKCPPPPEDKKITICHIPPGNNQNPQTIEINESAWPAHLAHGDTKGTCPTPTVTPPSGKIQICHIPPGNNQNPQTIEIPESAWPAHEAHGDAKMPCAPGEKKITICHIPPGNPNNPQTIEIAESAWPAHAAHGDTKGACPSNNVSPGKGKGGVKEGNDKGSDNKTDNTENGTKVPGRTSTPTTTEEPKTTEGPKKLTPR